MKIINMEVYGFKASFGEIGNPKKSDSKRYSMTKENLQSIVRGNAYELELLNEANVENFLIGEKDMKLAQTLISAGDGAYFLRQIHVWMDIEEACGTYHFNTNYAELRNALLLRKKYREDYQDTFYTVMAQLPYAKQLIFYGIEKDYERFIKEV